MIDIFKPEVSSVVDGIAGKSILIYGANRTGKTSNAASMPNSVVFAFENGLNALSGVQHFPMTKWSDWQAVVRDLSNPAKAERFKNEVASVMIIDTVEEMCDLAEKYICDMYNTKSIGRDSSGKKGYGYWQEYRDEVRWSISTIMKLGFTVIFISHEDVRTLLTETGIEYPKIYPSGDKATINYLCNACDITAYAQLQSNTEDGDVVPSSLLLNGTPAFMAGSRFKYLPDVIPEWNMEKLEAAITQAIAEEAKQKGTKPKKAADVSKKKTEKDKEEESKKVPIQDLIKAVGEKVVKIVQETGNKNIYEEVLSEELHNPDFRAQEATEKQREQLEQVLAALERRGY